MSSVFSTPPPDFSEKEISEFILNHFGLSSDAENLYSDRDQNFFIRPISDKPFILKISNCAEKRSVIEMQDEATKSISHNDPELGIPLQIGKIHTIEKDGISYFSRRIEYIRGKFLKDKNLDEKSHEKLGAFLGRLSLALHGFSHLKADRIFEWDVRNIDLIKYRCDYLNSESEKATIIHFLNEYEKNVIPLISDLRMAVIHNDGNEHNILVDEAGDAIGIIDFGDMVYSYQVSEPAICMAYVGLEKDNPFSTMAQILKGYHSVFRLNDSEIKSAIWLSCIRLCISVTMSAWRCKLFPDNQYLSISQKAVWDLLRKLEKEDLDALSIKIISIVK
ncbi:MAG: hypothetical protein CMG57_07415 [Candidatus Marinimicrobia bacterium]|nr:hypothetical protein [Candidatus Neomarinimicrobiota bacterium]